MVSKTRSVSIIIGVRDRHWLNWCWSVERFAGGRHVFGATVQLSAATRDFPLHGHLHASQTPKGCSFTQPPSDGWPASGWQAHEILPVARVKSRDGGCGGLKSDDAQLPKQTYDFNGTNRFLVGKLPWKIDTNFVERKARPSYGRQLHSTRIPQLVDSKYSLFFQRGQTNQDLPSVCNESNREPFRSRATVFTLDIFATRHFLVVFVDEIRDFWLIVVYLGLYFIGL